MDLIMGKQTKIGAEMRFLSIFFLTLLMEER